MGTDTQGVLASHGIPLAAAGFEVIWIPHAKKGPSIDDWQKIPTNEQVVRRWAANGKADSNVGVRTKYTPAVDIDILDAEMAASLHAWCLEHIGFAPSRIGRAPKVLLVYGTDTPFRKRNLKFKLPDGTTQKIEVLGDGQQFVAYGIHEDTRKPYVWTSKLGLSELELYDLTTIKPEHIDALFDEATRLGKERGWKVVQRTGYAPTRDESEQGDDDFDLADVQLQGTFTDEELNDALYFLDPDKGYDFWLQVGQALHHQFEGSQDGLDMWDAWSQKSVNYDAQEIASKWESFSVDRAGKSVTARSLIHWSKEAKAEQTSDTYDGIVAEIESATSYVHLTTTVIKSIAKRMDKTMLDPIVELIKLKAKSLGGKIATGTARKLVKSALREGKSRFLPDWCENFVYVTQDDRFYDCSRHRMISDRGFNALNNRHIIVSDEESPNATRFALDVLHLPVVDALSYMPGSPVIVEDENGVFVNTYSNAGVPEIPSLPDAAEEAAVKTFVEHLEMLFTDKRERELLMSWFAYMVQNLDKRIPWAPLIYGAEAIGKTFFSQLMRRILGPSNVMPVSAKQLNQQFTGWAEGRKLVVFEEIRLTGHNRFDVLEGLKPLITNETVDIRRMHVDTYTVVNRSNYLLFTNHEDALPLSDGDSRYFVLTCSLITKADVKDFKRENPKYFKRLFDAIKYHPGAILGFLMSYELCDEFNPEDRAPESEGKKEMRESSQDDEFDGLEYIIEQRLRYDVTPELLCIKSLKDLISSSFDIDDDKNVSMPDKMRLKPVLKQLGFSYVGRARPGKPGPQGKGTSMQRYWSRQAGAVKREGLQKMIHRLVEGDDLGF